NRLLKEPELQRFFETADFEKMLVEVGNDDVKSFKNNNEWLIEHPKEALIFKETENTWKEISKVYSEDFRYLVYGSFQEEKEILAVLQKITNRLKKIDWNIKFTE